jgi:hypothetical protein
MYVVVDEDISGGIRNIGGAADFCNPSLLAGKPLLLFTKISQLPHPVRHQCVYRASKYDPVLAGPTADDWAGAAANMPAGQTRVSSHFSSVSMSKSRKDWASRGDRGSNWSRGSRSGDWSRWGCWSRGGGTGSQGWVSSHFSSVSMSKSREDWASRGDRGSN